MGWFFLLDWLLGWWHFLIDSLVGFWGVLVGWMVDFCSVLLGFCVRASVWGGGVYKSKKEIKRILL